MFQMQRITNCFEHCVYIRVTSWLLLHLKLHTISASRIVQFSKHLPCLPHNHRDTDSVFLSSVKGVDARSPQETGNSGKVQGRGTSWGGLQIGPISWELLLAVRLLSELRSPGHTFRCVFCSCHSLLEQAVITLPKSTL